MEWATFLAVASFPPFFLLSFYSSLLPFFSTVKSHGSLHTCTQSRRLRRLISDRPAKTLSEWLKTKKEKRKKRSFFFFVPFNNRRIKKKKKERKTCFSRLIAGLPFPTSCRLPCDSSTNHFVFNVSSHLNSFTHKITITVGQRCWR